MLMIFHYHVCRRCGHRVSPELARVCYFGRVGKSMDEAACRLGALRAGVLFRSHGQKNG